MAEKFTVRTAATMPIQITTVPTANGHMSGAAGEPNTHWLREVTARREDSVCNAVPDNQRRAKLLWLLVPPTNSLRQIHAAPSGWTQSALQRSVRTAAGRPKPLD